MIRTLGLGHLQRQANILNQSATDTALRTVKGYSRALLWVHVSQADAWLLWWMYMLQFSLELVAITKIATALGAWLKWWLPFRVCLSSIVEQPCIFLPLLCSLSLTRRLQVRAPPPTPTQDSLQWSWDKPGKWTQLVIDAEMFLLNAQFVNHCCKKLYNEKNRRGFQIPRRCYRF